MSPVVAIVANPRCSGGARRRLDSIAELSEHVGYRVEVFQPGLSPDPRRVAAAVAPLLRGRTVPEVLAWNPGPVVRGLARLAPDVVVYQTIRALHPAVLEAVRTGIRPGPRRTVQLVDLVDRLSVSYRQRARAGGTVLDPAFRLLAATHERAEHGLVSTGGPETGLRLVAAGYREAAELGIHWIPNVPPSKAATGSDPGSIPDDGTIGPGTGHDAVFFGTLDYQPNVEALRTLHRWIIEDGHRPPSILVAGRNPTAEIRELCRLSSWTLEPDFSSVAHLARRAAVAIAPLRSTSGIQNKIMEAAQAGLAQVVTSAAVAGYHPDLPLPRSDAGHRFLAQLRHLVDNPVAARNQVAAVQRHLERTISVEAVAPHWARLLEPKSGDRSVGPAAGRHQPDRRLAMVRQGRHAESLQ